MSSQFTSKIENTHLAAGSCEMLTHQNPSKGSSEYKGVTHALIVSITMVLLSALAVSACNQPLAAVSQKENSASATAVGQESVKARESAYVQHKELGSIFAETQDPL